MNKGTQNGNLSFNADELEILERVLDKYIDEAYYTKPKEKELLKRIKGYIKDE